MAVNAPEEMIYSHDVLCSHESPIEIRAYSS